MAPRPPYRSVLLLSACALAYELLLMRLFAIIQWHHFAYMVIGLALLGYGVSGTLVTLFQRPLLRQFNSLYPLAIVLFGLTSAGCFQLAQLIPFNAEAILWDPWQALHLAALFLLLSLPFLFAASALCLAFMRFGRAVASIYAADLVGAAVGSLALVALLFVLFPQHLLLAIAALALATAGLACWELDSRPRLLLLSLLLAVIGTGLLYPSASAPLRLSPYKPLPQTLRVEGTQVLSERSSPLGLLTVVASDTVPFREAPGLSLNAPTEPAPQLALFTDGGSRTVISRFPGRLEDLAYLGYTTSALPYQLGPVERVLVVGAGGGSELLQALYYGVDRIDAVEINPQVVTLVDQVHGDFSGRIYSHPSVHVETREIREFLLTGSERYPLIQIAMSEGFNASSSGLYALHESYLYTVEALRLYLDHLRPGGVLALTRWINVPPRDSLKLLATVADALRLRGENPATRLVMVRSWNTATLLAKRGPFSAAELDAVRQFSGSRGFDIVYLPGLSADQANRYSRLRSPMFYDAASALLDQRRDSFLARYKFDLTPATDDRPYFHHFFRWQTFLELFSLRQRGGMSLIEWGYLVLIGTLLVATLASLLLVLLPLRWSARLRSTTATGLERHRVALYFAGIGLAFLLIEIAFMQRFLLFLHHPVYAIALTLTAFLLFAGIGSGWSAAATRRWGRHRTLWGSVLAIVAVGGLYLLLLGHLFAALATLPMPLKMALTVSLVAPLAFAMGIPFPLALASLAEHAPHQVPWAWGINGCASVIGASLATLLAIHFGFTLVILVALLIYLALPMVLPAPRTPAT